MKETTKKPLGVVTSPSTKFKFTLHMGKIQLELRKLIYSISIISIMDIKHKFKHNYNNINCNKTLLIQNYIIINYYYYKIVKRSVNNHDSYNVIR